jgi:HlyD family secretion protein
MKKYRWIIWVLVIALVGVGVWYWKFRKVEAPVVLETEKPFYGPIANSITATGTIQPVDTVSVGTQVSGTISAVYADFNSTVKKGQLIAELDKILLQAQVDQARASLQQAQSTLTYQKSNYERQKQLLDVGAVSRAEYEIALNQYEVAKNNVSSVASQLKAAQRNLSFASIYSPIDGTVLTRNVNVGQTVASSLNTPTLFVIARDLQRMQVQAAVDEADIGNVKNNQRVTFTVDAFPDETFEGSVKEVRLRPSISSNVVTYVTIVDAPNTELKLKPGMTASITVYTREMENALLISAKATKFRPDSSLLKNYTIERGGNRRGRQEGPGKIGSDATSRDAGDIRRSGRDSAGGEETKRAMVWVKKDSTLTRRMIITGLTDNTNVQVISGLSPDEIVVTGMQQNGTVAQGANSNENRSPFMPPRRGGNRGGGGGSGGSGGGRNR